MGADNPDSSAAVPTAESAPPPSSSSASSIDPAQPIAGRRPSEAEYEHLQWLGVRDQQVLCRGECASAIREEGRLLSELRSGIFAHHRAAEHCKAASANDSEWFTLDVQDCHYRKAKIMADALKVLESSTPPLPQDSDLSDRVFGGFFNGYAQSAQAVAAAKDSEQVQNAAASVRTAWGAIRRSLLEAGQSASAAAAGQSAPHSAPPDEFPTTTTPPAPETATTTEAASATEATEATATAASATSPPPDPITVAPAAPAAVDKNPQRPSAYATPTTGSVQHEGPAH
eukprot:CAMPEP_0206509906 /NCGR_PEP_ID=MMETSP0324_2-20121206/59254_1 /ASSEMBLY_ACC=CAM_ASM_000836 /TAXON_ID=2866 /ORGANISM="Crypthecodinium cohnii, Strain Seligo" /LENGTH=285 /DNA_ID=CAMNT_0054001145 /DNA_START=51 /DNA_END=908 /DNA_ORIENTATION=+